MPANKKHLEQSGWQRFLKITAAIVGGFIVSTSLHLALALYVSHIAVLITMTFTGFIIWCALMVLAFLAKNGYKIWGIYLGLTALFSILIFYGKHLDPLV